MGPYGSPVGVAVSYERGNPVLHLEGPAATHPHATFVQSSFFPTDDQAPKKHPVLPQSDRLIVSTSKVR